MKAQLLISILVFAFSALANETQNTSSADNAPRVIVQDGTSTDAIEAYNRNYNILNNAQKIRYLKNPCADKKGYHFNSFRGFAFENGIVKKLRKDGRLTYDRAASLSQFLSSRGVCKPMNKTIPVLNNVAIESLEIWN